MTVRQQFMKAGYPFLRWLNNITGANKSCRTSDANAIDSIYNLIANVNGGENISLSDFSGRKILIVNTASDCGFTAQYAELEALYQLHRQTLTIIAFPSNDFKQQEQKTDSEILTFCQRNFGVSFLVIKKAAVKKGDNQQPIFEWLCNSKKNGWNDEDPNWNFCKYLINESGNLTHVFGPGYPPLEIPVDGKEA